MMQVLQDKKGDSKSKLYSIYGYIIEGTFVKEQDEFIHFRDPSYQNNPVRKFKKSEIYKLVLSDGTIYLENNSLKATYERNFSLREKGIEAIPSDYTNVPKWKNESLGVNFSDGDTKTLYHYLFISGKDLLTEDTLLYKMGTYTYKTPVNKISTIKVKRFNKERSLSWTIYTAVFVSVILGAIVHRKVHCHHGEGPECE